MVQEDAGGFGRPKEAAVWPPNLRPWSSECRRRSSTPLRSYRTKRNSGVLVSTARRVRHPHRGLVGPTPGYGRPGRVDRKATGKGQASYDAGSCCVGLWLWSGWPGLWYLRPELGRSRGRVQIPKNGDLVRSCIRYPPWNGSLGSLRTGVWCMHRRAIPGSFLIAAALGAH